MSESNSDHIADAAACGAFQPGTSEVATLSAETVHGVSLQRWRTQRLFDLVVTAAGEEPGRVARALGIDSRAVHDMRAVPSLAYIGRIAHALGMTSASAAEVVGNIGMATDVDRASTAQLAAAIARADIEDDAASLDLLAESLARRARDPGDISLSVLCAARADAARGEVHQAFERARNVDVPADSCDSAGSAEFAIVAHDLRACIELESVLGEAWRGHAEPDARTTSIPTTKHLASCRHVQGDGLIAHARQCRRVAHDLVLELLRTPSRDLRDACDLLAKLRRHLFAAAESGCPHAVAWTASVAGIAALRIREVRTLPERVAATAMALFVSAQLLIDEEIARQGPASPMSLLRRRMRLSLHEWCDRARRGEVVDALLDEFDHREIQSLCARFPRARPGAIVGS